MAGRKLMEAHGLPPQVVLTFSILVGTDGVLKMSKSTGNYIGIDEPPGVIFTKVLNVPDSAMRNYAELVTRWRQEEIDALFTQIERGELTMRDFKHKLAGEIVSIFHGDEAAKQAAEDASRMHAGEAPSDATLVTLHAAKPIVDLLVEAGLTKSKGEARRLIEQGGVRVAGEPVTSSSAELTMQAQGEVVVQAGKRKFLRVQFRPS